MGKKIIVGLLIIGGISTVLYIYDYALKRGGVHYQVNSIKEENPKPILNVGCGCDSGGDVNLDVVDRSECVSNFVMGSGEDLSQFGDKQFSVAYAHHVLEHVDNPDAMISEMNRVADNTIIMVPKWYGPHAWVAPSHKWIFWDDKDLTKRTQIR